MRMETLMDQFPPLLLYVIPYWPLPLTRGQIYHMIGWKPSPTQPKPKPRGSADVSLKFLEQQPTEADYKRVVEQIKEKKS